ncbi:Hypothetical predicted protein, partial [Marmota monax]
DVEYIRSHYNIEDFIYFSHHQREEHGHLYHFALNPIFRHYTKFFLKEILRLSYKSCLYYPIYPQPRKGKFQNPYAHSLTSALHYLVPVRPRRQIVYPLEKLGINAPSKAVSKDPVGSRAAGREARCQLPRAWQMGWQHCLRGSRLLLNYREPGAHTLTGCALQRLPAAFPLKWLFHGKPETVAT